eukprot:g5607.t1
MRVHKAWTDKHWCKQVVKPHWPFSYRKKPGQTWEGKGRVVSSYQDMGHECTVFGARTKCHRCERIVSGKDHDQFSDYQLQGVDWGNLPPNVPTANDVPWAVDGLHRNDFGRFDGAVGTTTCVMLSGGACVDPLATSFADCKVRCWGANVNASRQRAIADSSYGTRWEYDRVGQDDPGALTPSQQGALGTLAGSGTAGHADGPAATAQFNFPKAAAVDKDQNVYVADTNNHCIRKIEQATGTVSTIAGRPGYKGYSDGPATTTAEGATFSEPAGIALYVERDTGRLVLVVADTGNHRIRRLRLPPAGSPATTVGTVETLSGQKGLPPQPGFGDGTAVESRFNEPRGIAAADDGHVFVADKLNHLIRRVSPNGMTTTVAGTTDIAQRGADGKKLPGCPPPCLKGVSGHQDGNLTSARFYHPTDVAMGPNHTIVVADSHRVRRITSGSVGPGGSDYDFPNGPGLAYPGGPGGFVSTIQTIESLNRVVTLAGQQQPGKEDGIGPEASLNEAQGVTVTADGAVYVADSANHRVRRIAPQAMVAKDVACTTRFDELVRPTGCASYDPPTDAWDLKSSPLNGNIYTNYKTKLTKRDILVQDVAGSARNPPADAGRREYNCQGSPPLDQGPSSSGVTTGPQDGTGWVTVDIPEDYDTMTQIKVRCPAGCGAGVAGSVVGGGVVGQAGVSAVAGAVPVGRDGAGVYKDTSLVCAAAVHAGVVPATAGGVSTEPTVIALTVEEGASQYAGSAANGITAQSEDVTALAAAAGGNPYGWRRSFSVANYTPWLVEVETVAGPPGAPLDTGHRGFADGRPASHGKLNMPIAVAAFPNATSLTAPTTGGRRRRRRRTDGTDGTDEMDEMDEMDGTDARQLAGSTSPPHSLLYIVDAENHRIRYLTATCS